MIDKLTQVGGGDTADHFRETDVKCKIAKWIVPAVVKLQTEDVATAAAPKTFGELMEATDIARKRSQITQGTFRPGSSYMRLGSGNHSHANA